MLIRRLWLVALAVLIGTPPLNTARAADAVNAVTPSVVIFAIPYWIAERNGYFKAEDIEPTLDIEPNGRKITERLLTGASQFSFVGPDAVLIDATKGGPLRILAGVVRKPPLFLIAKPSIKTFAQLRGANIGPTRSATRPRGTRAGAGSAADGAAWRASWPRSGVSARG